MVQDYPINDQGTGPAPVSKSNFQPLGTNVGAISSPQQNAQAALASMGQGGHNTNSNAIGASQNSNPYFRSVRRCHRSLLNVPSVILLSIGPATSLYWTLIRKMAPLQRQGYDPHGGWLPTLLLR